MDTIAPQPEEGADDSQDFKPLTAEQAQRLREAQPSMSPWTVVVWQCVVGAALALALGGITGRSELAGSAGYGALAVVVPAAVFARGLRGRVSSANAGAAAIGFLVWEIVKLALTVAMLFAAPRVVHSLSWPALLAGMLVTMKVYWLALAWRPRGKR